MNAVYAVINSSAEDSDMNDSDSLAVYAMSDNDTNSYWIVKPDLPRWVGKQAFTKIYYKV